MNTRGITVLAAAAAWLTACSGGAEETAGSTTGSPKETHSASPTGKQSGTSSGATTDVARSCGMPSEALVDRAKVAIATHPGPVTATTLVFAAETPTGKWFVLGLDRAYVHDDGSLAGGASRNLALVRVDGQPGSATMIPVATDHHDGKAPPTPVEDWSSVTWRGDLLDQGKAAVAKAVECLDAQGTGD